MARRPPIERNAGRAALVALLQRTRRFYVAARCRVTPRAVGHWTSGIRTPSARARAALLASYGIAIEAWDRPAP